MTMQKQNGANVQQGLTLVEVMIAMALGLLVTLAVTSLFLSQRQSYRENESVARMQENARFALELITQDLRHAGFFGEVSEPVEINVRTEISEISGIPILQDCAGGIFEFSSTQFLLAYGNTLADPDSTVLADCVATSEINSGGSSVLVVKRSASVATATPVADRVYTHANGASAELFTTDYPTTLTGGENWAYTPFVYFIDDDDSLRRRYMSNDEGTLVSETLADGIEAFHIEFGIDADKNGTPEYFYSPGNNAVTDNTLDSAVSVKVYVLARTQGEDNSYTDQKTYQLGSLGLGPFNDNFHRRVYTTTTALKNIRSHVMLDEGI